MEVSTTIKPWHKLVRSGILVTLCMALQKLYGIEIHGLVIAFIAATLFLYIFQDVQDSIAHYGLHGSQASLFQRFLGYGLSMLSWLPALYLLRIGVASFWKNDPFSDVSFRAVLSIQLGIAFGIAWLLARFTQRQPSS